MTVFLKNVTLVLSAILSGITAYEAHMSGKKTWQVMIPALTALGLLALAAYRFGLLVH